MISGKTNVLAIIGNPVEHSLSPCMQNAALKELGLDYVYLAFPVREESLAEALTGFTALGIKGANVTIPHKINALNYMDELHESAEKVGAVNTIKNDSGELIGFNTDGEGMLRSLRNEVSEIESKSVLLLGAGGAARAIGFSIVEAGASLTISNRTASKAKKLAETISGQTKGDVRQVELSKKVLIDEIKNSDILINATSVGMEPNTDETLVSADMMHSDLIVNDIVYKPLKTKLLEEAEKAGAKTIDGLGMLVHQGATSLEIWTGEKAPIKVMRKATENAIKEE
ncbi:MAG: shikimate dehydrogenase [Hadesarchaea archaeon]|nr:shikimate dehydrogenase [Hadesarchaea archaeon]